MITIVLTACPESLRGHLTRWFSEVSPGVFVGNVNPRIRDRLWELIQSESKRGRAIMTYSSRELEQGYSFKVHNHDWEIADCEGLHLVRRRSKASTVPRKPEKGWSRAGQKRRFGR